MNFISSSTSLVATALSIAMLASPALAEKKPPKGSTGTDPNVIFKLYAGKTSNWDRGGSAYWKSNGEFEGISKGGSLGLGKWFVTTKSKLCQDATYYWQENGAVKSQGWKGCWEFKTAPDGTIWERFLPEKTEWYRHKTSKQVSGNPQKRKIIAMRKELGV